MAECRTCAERYGRGVLLAAYEQDEKPPGGLQCGACGRFCSPRAAVPVKYFPDLYIDHYICANCNHEEHQTA